MTDHSFTTYLEKILVVTGVGAMKICWTLACYWENKILVVFLYWRNENYLSFALLCYFENSTFLEPNKGTLVNFGFCIRLKVDTLYKLFTKFYSICKKSNPPSGLVRKIVEKKRVQLRTWDMFFFKLTRFQGPQILLSLFEKVIGIICNGVKTFSWALLFYEYKNMLREQNKRKLVKYGKHYAFLL